MSVKTEFVLPQAAVPRFSFGPSRNFPRCFCRAKIKSRLQFDEAHSLSFSGGHYLYLLGGQNLGNDAQDDPLALQGSNTSWDNICSRNTVEKNGDCRSKIGTEPLAEDCVCCDHRGTEDNTDKSVENVFRPATTSYKGWSCSSSSSKIPSLPEPNQRDLKVGHNRIWMKTEEVDSRFTMLKNDEVPKYMLHKA